jgi:hypothetical protein
MTHFPYGWQQSVPSESILEVSGVFQKQLASKAPFRTVSARCQTLGAPVSRLEAAGVGYPFVGTACHASRDDPCRVIVSRIVQLSSLLAHQRQSTVLTLSTSLSNGVSANGRRCPTHTRATRFGTVPALKTVAMLRIDQEAAMWKITTRGFTLEEVLIMAAMNLLLMIT